MKRMGRWIAGCLAFVLLVSTVAAATLNFDRNGDGKTNVWDLQMVLSGGSSAEDQKAALNEALDGGDELHKNAKGEWEIWSALGLYNMAKNAQAGDTFVLMQDIDMEGKQWTPVKNFNGKLIGGLHTISNMKINQDVDGNMGFFADIADDGYVEYLNLKDVNLIASKDAVNIGLLAGTCSGKIFGSTTIGFVTDERTTFAAPVYVGGMVGKMTNNGVIESIDNNKLPDGITDEISTISSKLGTRFAVIDGHIVGIVGAGADAVDAGTLLQDLTGIMADPNAIAWVSNGDKMVYPLNLDDLIAAVSADGNSVITLQADLTNNAAISLPFTCTLDCNGFSIATPPTRNNGINILKAGTDNKVFTIKNGTLTHYEIGVRSGEGAVVISNMTIVSNGGAPVGLYDTTDYSAINKIENSTLVSKNWGCIVFNGSKADMSNTGITIENSTLVASKSGGHALFIINQASLPGKITLGANVNMYSYGTALTSKVEVAGVDPVQMQDTASVTVLDVTYSGLNHWTTDESVIATGSIAEVTNNGEVTQVTNATDLVKQIQSNGNTQIKLLKDITRGTSLVIPYSCTIDLNGHSITCTSGNALTIDGVGTSNKVTRIKNGTLNHSILGIRVNDGSIDLYNVKINGIGTSGVSVGFYNTNGAYRANNKIDNCTIYNPQSQCIKWMTDADFSNTGVKITNTTLVAAKNYAFGMVTKQQSGVNELGENVEIYCPKWAISDGTHPRFSGLLAGKSDQTSVTVNGVAVTGVKHWSTDIQKETTNIFMIGNSLTTTIPEELYNIATKDGQSVKVCIIYYPGCKSWQHWDWLNNDTPNYQYRIYSEMGLILHGDIKTSREALADMEWDHITYQDWFMPDDAFTLDQLYDRHQADAYNMMQYLNENYPNAKHYYYEHWAWQVGRLGTETVENQTAMWNRIKTASEKFAADNEFILIPCGEAYQLARADARIGDTLCQDDKLHDNGPTGGQYLNGCVFYETIFRRSCIGDTWRASNGPSEEKHQILQQIAHETIIKIHGEDWVKE